MLRLALLLPGLLAWGCSREQSPVRIKHWQYSAATVAEAKQAFNKLYDSLPALEPVDRSKVQQLRMLVVNEPGLPALSDAQVLAFTREVEAQTWQLLGYRIKIVPVGEVPIERFFSGFDPVFNTVPFLYPVAAWSIAPDDQQQIKATIVKRIAQTTPEILQSYFGETPTGQNQVDHIYGIFKTRLDLLLTERTRDGAGLKQRFMAGYFNYPHWSVIAYNQKQTEIILTNSMIAGPDTGMPLYVINRGGITSAFVENNLHNPYGALCVFATHQYLSDGEFFRQQRGELPPEMLIPVMARMMVHELGHFLMRLDEYYDLPGSVHMAPRDLNYLQWYRAVDPSIHPVDLKQMRLIQRY